MGTGKGHVLDSLWSRHELRPQLPLRAEDVLGLGRGQCVGHRLVLVHVGERRVGDLCQHQQRIGLGLVLREIEIDGITRGHDDIVPSPRRRDAAGFATPRHDCCAAGQAALQNLVPADQAAAAGAQKRVHAADQPTLQFVLVLQPFLPHPRLAPRAFAPPCFRAFVPTDMNEWRGEKGQNLLHDLFQKRQGLVVAQAIHVLKHAPLGGHLERPAGAGKLGIGSERGEAVPGHFNLRHHRDLSHGGIGDDLTHFILGVKPTVRNAVPRPFFRTEDGLGTPGPDFGQARIFFDLDSPALIFGEMPVEDIVFEPRQLVNKPLEERHRHEVPAAIEMHAAPGKARPIVDV